MKRRTVCIGVTTALVWPRSGRAQAAQRKVRLAVLDGINKILKGTPPDEIPFVQSSKFALVLNVKAARELGLQVPQSVRVSADGVIE